MVGGDISVSGNAATSTVDLSSLQSAGGNVTIASNGPAVVVNLTRLQSVGGVNPATIRLQGGTVLFNSVSGFLLPANASLTGSASLVGKIMSRGVISPGNSPGRFDLTGNLTLATGSELRLELGGPSPGTQHDFVSVSGSTIVGGTLTVSLINNFQSVMAPGASFTVLTSGNAITGAFSNVVDGGTITTTDGYARFTVNYAGANAVRLSGLVIVDSDGDGLPDWWEDQFGLNKNNPADAQLDSDGDGVSNLNEFRAGTSPNNPASAFRVVMLTRETNDMRVTWSALGGKSYVVQATSSLTVPFVDISPLINVSGTIETTMDYVDTGVLPGTQRFYRVRLGP